MARSFESGMFLVTAVVAFVSSSMSVAATGAPMTAPSNLRVEGLLSDVAFISEPKPRFAFTPPAVPLGSFGVVQTSYRITVSARGATTPVWDSGNVASAATSEIVYGGSALKPLTRYVWTAELATSDSTSGAANGFFETGPMLESDWDNAKWLTGSQFRREFEVPAGSTVEWARAYVAAPGCATVEVNGMAPNVNLRGICPWVVSTNDQINSRYMTHDITTAVVAGSNAIGVVAGNVMSTTAQFMAVVVVKLTSGSTVTFNSGSTGWMMRNQSYVTASSAWHTSIDWMLWEPSWSKPGGATSAWANAVGVVGDFPLRALQMPLSAVLEEVKPVKVEALAGGDFLYTFPKNFVGTVRIAALPKAAAGSPLQILAGEWLVEGSIPTPSPPIPPNPHPARCAEVLENQIIKLGGCSKGHVIDSIVFASFGTPTGSCKAGFKINKQCNSAKSMAVISAACMGRADCSVHANNVAFGGDPCDGTAKLLAAQVTCSGDDNHTLTTTTGVDTNISSLVSDTVLSTTQTNPLPPLPPAGNGTVPMISGRQQQFEKHILRAGNTNDIETVFCWHGFQYVRVTPGNGTGFAGTLDSITGLAIHTNMSSTGKIVFGGDGVPKSLFEQAAAVLNGIFSMTLQSQRTNVAAYMPTDCPTREKHGWMGDALDASEEALYNFDMLAVHTAFLQTIEDNQGPNGDVPTVVPNGVPGATSCNDIAWTSAYPQISNMLYKYYGDARVVEQHWPSLYAYQENLIEVANKSPAGIAECDRYNDWLCGNAQSCCSNSPSGATCPVGAEMGSYNYVLGLRAMSEMAAVVGNSTASARYASIASSATVDFHNTFYSPQFKQYGGDYGATQSLNLPAMFINSPPSDLRPEILDALQADVVTAGLRVGAVTSKVLLDVLSDNNLHETAMRTATATTEPSWGYWWTQNSSTCWESWPINHGTRNHIFLCGGVVEWMWKYLVGLVPTTSQFAEVSITPLVSSSGPATVNGEFVSPRGVISSGWSIATIGELTLNVSLPVGVQRATIVVPKPFAGSPSPAPPATLCHSDSEHDGAVLNLACKTTGATIKSFEFVSFGTPTIDGVCSSWVANGTCNAANSTTIVENICVGKSECSIDFDVKHTPFGDPCPNVVKTLAARFTCGGGTDGPPQVTSAVVYEGGMKVWDGKAMVGTHPGIKNATDAGEGVAFDVSNGVFAFKSTPIGCSISA